MKEKIILEKKLVSFEENSNEKNELKNRLFCIEVENKSLNEELEKIKNLYNKIMSKTKGDENNLKELEERNDELEQKNEELCGLITENSKFSEKLAEIKALIIENDKEKLEKIIFDSKAVVDNTKLYQQQFEEKIKEIQYLVELNQGLEKEKSMSHSNMI